MSWEGGSPPDNMKGEPDGHLSPEPGKKNCFLRRSNWKQKKKAAVKNANREGRTFGQPFREKRTQKNRQGSQGGGREELPQF